MGETAKSFFIFFCIGFVVSGKMLTFAAYSLTMWTL